MREFRLKRWYPSLPWDWKDNMIIVVEGTHNYQLHPSLDRSKITAKGIPHNEVNQSEFWEEIKPMLTTEDGVEVHEGDDVYKVCTLKEGWDVHKSYMRPEIANPPIYFKYFSTLEKAQNFVIFNKPMFSINDVKELLKGKFNFPIQSMFIDAAKLKLKI